VPLGGSLVAANVLANAALAISARYGGGNQWDGTLTGAQFTADILPPIPSPFTSYASYNLQARTRNDVPSFTGNWQFILGGYGVSSGKNTFSSSLRTPVKLYTSALLPSNEASFAGVVVFLAAINGLGSSYQAFIAGSGFGQFVTPYDIPFAPTPSKAPFAALAGSVGISIYNPFIK
ncbi:MAG: hypothetical protein ACKO96_00010, partial [Flammeovirgaceae bacterium]